MRLRTDELTSQTIETGLIFKQMLGVQDAREYLSSRNVSQTIIERVLYDGKRRSNLLSSEPHVTGLLSLAPPRLNESFYSNSGRRKDVLRMAVVQAALALRTQMGSERVEHMLNRELVPRDVIARVMRGEAGTLRVRGVVS